MAQIRIGPIERHPPAFLRWGCVPSIIDLHCWSSDPKVECCIAPKLDRTVLWWVVYFVIALSATLSYSLQMREMRSRSTRTMIDNTRKFNVAKN
eukprot:scaffold779_cov252-Chaetoceros_neogracile.AAC.6